MNTKRHTLSLSLLVAKCQGWSVSIAQLVFSLSLILFFTCTGHLCFDISEAWKVNQPQGLVDCLLFGLPTLSLSHCSITTLITSPWSCGSGLEAMTVTPTETSSPHPTHDILDTSNQRPVGKRVKA